MCAHIGFYNQVEAKMSFLTSVVVSAGAFYSTVLYCLFPKCIKAVRCKLGASKHFLHRVMSWSVVQLALNFPSVSSAKHKLRFKSNVLFGHHVLI